MSGKQDDKKILPFDLSVQPVRYDQLQNIIQLIINRSIEELKPLLPNYTYDPKNRKELQEFCSKTQLIFIRLYVLILWCKHKLPQLNKLRELTGELDEKIMALDKTMEMTGIIHNSIANQREPDYDFATAVDILSTGAFKRLPKSMENPAIFKFLLQNNLSTSIVHPQVLEANQLLNEESDSQQSDTKSCFPLSPQNPQKIERLNVLLQMKLYKEKLPKSLRFVSVQNGTLLLRDKNRMFELLMSLYAEKPENPQENITKQESGHSSFNYIWRIVKLSLLVNEKGIKSSPVDAIQANRLLSAVQFVLSKKLVPDVFFFVNKKIVSICLDLASDILYHQTVTLEDGELKSSIKVEKISFLNPENGNKQIIVDYWPQIQPSQNDIPFINYSNKSIDQENLEKELCRSSEFAGRLTIFQDISDKNQKMGEDDDHLLKIACEPEIWDKKQTNGNNKFHSENQEKEDHFAIDYSSLNVASYIIKCLHQHSQKKLKFLHKVITNYKNSYFFDPQEEVKLNISNPSKPEVIIPLYFESYHAIFSCNWKTGAYTIKIVSKIKKESPSDIRDKENEFLYLPLDKTINPPRVGGENNLLRQFFTNRLPNLENLLNYDIDSVFSIICSLKNFVVLFSLAKACKNTSFNQNCSIENCAGLDVFDERYLSSLSFGENFMGSYAELQNLLNQEKMKNAKLQQSGSKPSQKSSGSEKEGKTKQSKTNSTLSFQIMRYPMAIVSNFLGFKIQNCLLVTFLSQKTRTSLFSKSYFNNRQTSAGTDESGSFNDSEMNNFPQFYANFFPKSFVLYKKHPKLDFSFMELDFHIPHMLKCTRKVFKTTKQLDTDILNANFYLKLAFDNYTAKVSSKIMEGALEYLKMSYLHQSVTWVHSKNTENNTKSNLDEPKLRVLNSEGLIVQIPGTFSSLIEHPANKSSSDIGINLNSWQMLKKQQFEQLSNKLVILFPVSNSTHTVVRIYRTTPYSFPICQEKKNSVFSLHSGDHYSFLTQFDPVNECFTLNPRLSYFIPEQEEPFLCFAPEQTILKNYSSANQLVSTSTTSETSSSSSSSSEVIIFTQSNNNIPTICNFPSLQIHLCQTSSDHNFNQILEELHRVNEMSSLLNQMQAQLPFKFTLECANHCCISFNFQIPLIPSIFPQYNMYPSYKQGRFAINPCTAQVIQQHFTSSFEVFISDKTGFEPYIDLWLNNEKKLDGLFLVVKHVVIPYCLMRYLLVFHDKRYVKQHYPHVLQERERLKKAQGGCGCACSCSNEGSSSDQGNDVDETLKNSMKEGREPVNVEVSMLKHGFNLVSTGLTSATLEYTSQIHTNQHSPVRIEIDFNSDATISMKMVPPGNGSTVLPDYSASFLGKSPEQGKNSCVAIGGGKTEVFSFKNISEHISALVAAFHTIDDERNPTEID